MTAQQHAFIKPKRVSLKNIDGEEKEFVLSRIPCIPMRELMAKYPVSNIPKLGEYNVSAEAMKLLMSYCAVVVGPESDQREIPLVNSTLINQHVDDGEQLLRLEYAALEYNTSFFGQGGLTEFLKRMVAEHLPLIIQTVTASLPQSSPRDLRASPSSEPKST